MNSRSYPYPSLRRLTERVLWGFVDEVVEGGLYKGVRFSKVLVFELSFVLVLYGYSI